MLAILVRSRYLIQEFVTRDVRSRYLGSILGMFWSILNPLFQLILYTIIFSLVLKVRFGPGETTGAFALIVFCALLPWTAIQESTTRSARGFLEHSNLIKKLSFPLETIPFSYVCSAAIHQILGWIVFLIILLVFGSLQIQHLFLLPILFLVQVVLMFGLALIFGCLNVFFRDIYCCPEYLYKVERCPCSDGQALGMVKIDSKKSWNGDELSLPFSER